MKKSVAIQMDAIASINPALDTSLMLGLEAQARGYTLYYYQPKDLSYQDGAVTARAHPITLRWDVKDYYTLGEAITLNLGQVDVVLMRQDPPFNLDYITATYWLEMLAGKVLVVNDPASVRNHPEKLFPTLFRQFAPPTLISADKEAIRAFRAAQKDIVLKPLYGFGGNGVFRIAPGDNNFEALMEWYFNQHNEPLVVQRFLPEVKSEDRRIILIDGEVGAVMGRIPQGDEIRANSRIGGGTVQADLTPGQRKLCDALGPVLRAKGIVLAGIDVIGDYLIEVNITSPTGLRGMEKLYGINLAKPVWDAIEKRV